MSGSGWKQNGQPLGTRDAHEDLVRTLPGGTRSYKRKREVYTSRPRIHRRGCLVLLFPYADGALDSLSLERALATNVDLDLLRLGFSFLRQLDLQDALVIVGRDALSLNCVGQSEGAG